MTTHPLASPSVSAQEITLSNGSKLIFKHLEGAPRIALNIYNYGGNRIETLPGIADMVDDLLSDGTHKRSAEQIALDLDSLSLDMESDTKRDYNTVSTTFLEEDLEASVELLSDLLYHSTLAEFEKEKVRLQGELIMELDSPKNRAHDLFMSTMFQNTPYQASSTNILKTIPQITSVEPLMAHYQRVYQPQNTFFVAVGDMNIEPLKRALEHYFVRGQGQNLSEEGTPDSFIIPENQYVTASKDDSSQLHIYKGWFAPPLNHPDYYPMVVLNTILGGAGLTSRLFLELRDKQGLAYVVRSQFESSKYTGIFSLYIGTEPNNRQKALKGFEVECDKLMQHPVGHKELEEAKENIQGRRVVFLETAPQQCTYIGNYTALGARLADLDQLQEKINAVTALEVQTVAQKYLSQPAVIAAVGPSSHL